MIQRIQSFFLVLAICCLALSIMFPVAEYHATVPATRQVVKGRLDLFAHDAPEMYNQMLEGASEINYSQKVSGMHTWPLAVLTLAAAAVALISIFLYRNRVQQMRVVAVGFLLNVIEVFLLFFWAVDDYGKHIIQGMQASDLQVQWHVGAYAPIVALVFFILAHRGIKKDEAKVRAADRLR